LLALCIFFETWKLGDGGKHTAEMPAEKSGEEEKNICL
jgi:hypothetical protein